MEKEHPEGTLTWGLTAINFFVFLLSMPLATIWGCKEILPEQDPETVTPSQSYVASLIHRPGIRRHPIGRWHIPLLLV